jgi:NAD(P)-dependent dehydrogenase (short-subunit alcohol dehydrogenase family)
MGILEGKVAIVTGAAQGIGRAIAERFAGAGARVTVADVNDALGAEVAQAIEVAGGRAQFVHCDVALTPDVDRMVGETMAAFDGVDILVNNAAIAGYKLLVDTSDDEWDRVIAVNLRSIFLTARRCIPLMQQRGGGSIINFASVHARTTSTGNPAYIASKGAVVALTRTMALECAPANIRVNCILPGAIATPMLLENWGDVPPEQNPLMARIPVRRFGTPDEIARVAQFLASDESSYMTGSDVLVDGALSAHFD